MVKTTVCLITHDSGRTLEACLRAVECQSAPFHQVLALDNASTDDSPTLLQRRPWLQLTASPVNLGFAAGFNRLFAQATGDWILTLNPDARLAPDFNEKIAAVLAGPAEAATGMISPKILRASGNGLAPTDIFDSAGIRWTLLFRHVDMGSNERDAGQFDRPARVFGPTGAAALYRRSALEAVALGGQVMDERFFAYREDADLAFRLQWQGFHCLYRPELQAWHERRVLPEKRRRLPAVLNYHSLKNRHLMRLKDLTPTLGLLLLPTTIPYELSIFLYCLLRERSSLPAYTYAARTRGSSRRWRRHTLGGRRVSSWTIFSYFLRGRKYPPARRR